MKKIILIMLAISLVAFVSCKKPPAAAAAADATKSSDPSYAFGIAIGTSLKDIGIEVKYDQFLNGMKDVLDGKKKQKLTNDEATQVIQTAITAASAKKGEANIKKETDFLAANGKKAGIITTASGLQYEILKAGDGAAPVATDTVKVDYVGTLLDGTTFDSSIARGTPAEFPLTGVIPGWTEGMQLMKVGGKTKFYIPSRLAYGPTGAGSSIPPNSTLIFEVTLLSITTPKK